MRTPSAECPAILVVAGSDSSGGAGFAADVRTATALGAQVRLAVTAITVQGPRGVRAIDPVAPRTIGAQIASGLCDPAVGAVKIGMLGYAAAVDAAAEALVEAGHRVPVVLDPVLAASSGGLLLDEDGIARLILRLLPLSTLVTPNLPELRLLAARLGVAEFSVEEAAAAVLSAGASAVLVKGGHATGLDSEDLLFARGKTSPQRFSAPRFAAGLRGTGCTLSSAIAVHLAMGRSLDAACGFAKQHITGLFSAEAKRVSAVAASVQSASNIRM